MNYNDRKAGSEPDMNYNEHTALLLEDAINVINERGWCQDESMASDGRVCALGAIDVAALEAALRNGQDESMASDGRVRALGAIDVAALVAALRNDHFTQRNKTNAIMHAAHAMLDDIPPFSYQFGELVAEFNDRPATSKEDVLLGLKQAVANVRGGE